MANFGKSGFTTAIETGNEHAIIDFLSNAPELEFLDCCSMLFNDYSVQAEVCFEVWCVSN